MDKKIFERLLTEDFERSQEHLRNEISKTESRLIFLKEQLNQKLYLGWHEGQKVRFLSDIYYGPKKGDIGTIEEIQIFEKCSVTFYVGIKGGKFQVTTDQIEPISNDENECGVSE